MKDGKKLMEIGQRISEILADEPFVGDIEVEPTGEYIVVFGSTAKPTIRIKQTNNISGKYPLMVKWNNNTLGLPTDDADFLVSVITMIMDGEIDEVIKEV